MQKTAKKILQNLNRIATGKVYEGKNLEYELNNMVSQIRDALKDVIDYVDNSSTGAGVQPIQQTTIVNLEELPPIGNVPEGYVLSVQQLEEGGKVVRWTQPF